MKPNAHTPPIPVAGFAPPTAPLDTRDATVYRPGALDYKGHPSIVNGKPVLYKSAMPMCSNVSVFANLRNAHE